MRDFVVTCVMYVCRLEELRKGKRTSVRSDDIRRRFGVGTANCGGGGRGGSTGSLYFVNGELQRWQHRSWG